MNSGFFQPTIKGQIDTSVELKTSDIHGKGLFAKEDIPKSTKIHATHIQVEGYGWINIRPNNLHNHSKMNENCIVKTEDNFRILFSLRDIKKGEELLTDYTKDEQGFEQPLDTWEK